MRVSGGGTDSFRIRVLQFDYSSITRVSSTFLRFLRRACDVYAFLALSVSHGAATPPLLPTLTVYLLCGTFIGFLGMCGIWFCVFHVAFAMITRMIPAQVLPVALCSVAVVVEFSPIPRF